MFPTVEFQEIKDCLVNVPAVTVLAYQGHVTFTVLVASTLPAGHLNDATSAPLLFTGIGPCP